MSGAPAIRLTADWVARAMAGAIRSGDPGREFGGVSIDTRTLAAGELFIGIHGEQFDGADFADRRNRSWRRAESSCQSDGDGKGQAAVV